MARYFINVTTLEQLRKQYKELLKTYHPDNGGNVSDMQDINAEYDQLFKVLKDWHDTNQTSSDKGKENYDNISMTLQKIRSYVTC